MHRCLALNEVVLPLDGIHVVRIRIESSQLGQFVDDGNRFHVFGIGKFGFLVQNFLQEVTAYVTVPDNRQEGRLKRPLLFVAQGDRRNAGFLQFSPHR